MNKGQGENPDKKVANVGPYEEHDPIIKGGEIVGFKSKLNDSSKGDPEKKPAESNNTLKVLVDAKEEQKSNTEEVKHSSRRRLSSEDEAIIIDSNILGKSDTDIPKEINDLIQKTEQGIELWSKSAISTKLKEGLETIRKCDGTDPAFWGALSDITEIIYTISEVGDMIGHNPFTKQDFDKQEELDAKITEEDLQQAEKNNIEINNDATWKKLYTHEQNNTQESYLLDKSQVNALKDKEDDFINTANRTIDLQNNPIIPPKNLNIDQEYNSLQGFRENRDEVQKDLDNLGKQFLNNPKFNNTESFNNFIGSLGTNSSSLQVSCDKLFESMTTIFHANSSYIGFGLVDFQAILAHLAGRFLTVKQALENNKDLPNWRKALALIDVPLEDLNNLVHAVKEVGKGISGKGFTEFASAFMPSLAAFIWGVARLQAKNLATKETIFNALFNLYYIFEYLTAIANTTFGMNQEREIQEDLFNLTKWIKMNPDTDADILKKIYTDISEKIDKQIFQKSWESKENIGKGKLNKIGGYLTATVKHVISDIKLLVSGITSKPFASIGAICAKGKLVENLKNIWRPRHDFKPTNFFSRNNPYITTDLGVIRYNLEELRKVCNVGEKEGGIEMKEGKKVQPKTNANLNIEKDPVLKPHGLDISHDGNKQDPESILDLNEIMKNEREDLSQQDALLVLKFSNNTSPDHSFQETELNKDSTPIRKSSSVKI